MADIESIATQLSLTEALTLLKPLSVFIVAVAIYSIFIFFFYKFVARREIFQFNLHKYDHAEYGGIKKFSAIFLYLVKHILIFPIFTFFWFIVLTVILAFLSKQDNAGTTLLISITLVAVIRITAYYNEDLSKDLAKMLPFALLGIFLVDISFFSLETSINTILQLPQLWVTVTYYLVFIILLEFILRMTYLIFRSDGKKEEQTT